MVLSLVTHLDNSFWIIFFLGFFGHADIFLRVLHCRFDLFFFFPFCLVCFFCFYSQDEAFVYVHFSFFFFFLGEGFLWVACSPVYIAVPVDIGEGENGIYIHNLQRPAKRNFTSTLHGMCMYSNTSKFK